jgi:hypothetical protein
MRRSISSRWRKVSGGVMLASRPSTWPFSQLSSMLSSLMLSTSRCSSEQRIADFELLLDYGADMVVSISRAPFTAGTGTVGCLSRRSSSAAAASERGLSLPNDGKDFRRNAPGRGRTALAALPAPRAPPLRPPGQDKGLQRVGHALPAALHDGPAEIVELGLRLTARHEVAASWRSGASANGGKSGKPAISL